MQIPNGQQSFDFFTGGEFISPETSETPVKSTVTGGNCKSVRKSEMETMSFGIPASGGLEP